MYFDDVTITHTPTNIIQYNEYYPFGLQVATSWTRENNKNDYLYNEGSELNATSGWYGDVLQKLRSGSGQVYAG
ncbi:hypothetical protein [Chryseosolibacter histidini]|uniref:hypothetical protein n=1 Tax=Chryseosolibacter histidini TaxID=2782349 RepID=UPI0020B43499|nr:hypothetical protein [Chryseosolibacter histidini]